MDFKIIKRQDKKSKRLLLFDEEPLKYLLNKCNKDAKDSRDHVYRRSSKTNIKYVGYYAVQVKDNLASNSVKEMIRIIDAKKEMEEYVKAKFPSNYDFIDISTRNVFANKIVTVSMITYSHGFNHYGLCGALINKKNIGDDYP